VTRGPLFDAVKLSTQLSLGAPGRRLPTLQRAEGLFTEDPALLTDWLK
jgi:hypothetical protein